MQSSPFKAFKLEGKTPTGFDVNFEDGLFSSSVHTSPAKRIVLKCQNEWGFIVFSGQRSHCFSLVSSFAIGREIPHES